MAEVSSFDLEDSKDFPTLGSEPLDLIPPNKKTISTTSSDEDEHTLLNAPQQKEETKRSRTRHDAKAPTILPDSTIFGDHFVSGHIGVRYVKYRTDLTNLLKHQHQLKDFIITPISSNISPKQDKTDDNRNSETNGTESRHQQYLPDLLLSRDDWQRKVIVELTFPSIDDEENQPQVRQFEESFKHALYLETPIILISCPGTDFACITIASLINRLIPDRRANPSIVLKLPFIKPTCREDWNQEKSQEPVERQSAGKCIVDEINFEPGDSGHNSSDSNDGSLNNQTESLSPSTSHTTPAQSWTEMSYSDPVNELHSKRNSALCTLTDVWDQWCAFRSSINPLRSIGVCLEVSEELINDYIGSLRWMGEPVRLIILKRDQFTRLPGANDNNPSLPWRYQDFLTQTILANSFKLGLVVESTPSKQPGNGQNYSVATCLQYLDRFYTRIFKKNCDSLRTYDDCLLLPLQPLSSDLNSETYATFESDKRKYLQYKLAMMEALKCVQDRYGTDRPDDKPLILMVLGAGRGPLVDCFIEAIEDLSYKSKIKIFALDKNTSSVIALRYKLATSWRDRRTGDGNLIEVEVAESDMRVWEPEEKADIIATELLGSFGCNELSPECIDGVWKFCTERTISIPRDYTSYISPLTSYRIYQNVCKKKHIEKDKFAFDRVYVCKLRNVHSIAEPKELFTFSHKDVSKPPGKESTNDRYMKLNFTIKDNVICHGFGGYFSATLFGTKTLSTVPEKKTPNMDSWFPAFIPLQCPIELNRGDTMEVHFWRKTSSASVWYEWLVTRPVRSRLHTMMADGKGMSKII